MKANYCPNCGNIFIKGGISDIKVLLIVAAFFFTVIGGIVLWAVWRKAHCIHCGNKWKPTVKTEYDGYQKHIAIYPNMQGSPLPNSEFADQVQEKVDSLF